MNLNKLVFSTLTGAVALASIATSANGADRKEHTSPSANPPRATPAHGNPLHGTPPHSTPPISLQATLQPNVCEFDAGRGPFSRIVNNGKTLWFGDISPGAQDYTGAVIDAHQAAAVSWSIQVEEVQRSDEQGGGRDQDMFVITELEATDGSITYPRTEATFKQGAKYGIYNLSFTASQPGSKFHHIYLFTHGFGFTNMSDIAGGDIKVNGKIPMILMSTANQCQQLQ